MSWIWSSFKWIIWVILPPQIPLNGRQGTWSFRIHRNHERIFQKIQCDLSHLFQKSMGRIILILRFQKTLPLFQWNWKSRIMLLPLHHERPVWWQITRRRTPCFLRYRSRRFRFNRNICTQIRRWRIINGIKNWTCRPQRKKSYEI